MNFITKKGIGILATCIVNFLPAAHGALTDSTSWLTNALKLQRQIDMDAPLREATFLGTHNSYNSKAYQKPFIRYLDPNQLMTIYDQLELGIRSIELDAHWTWSDKFKKEILLCHGQPSHLGCSLYDKPISDAFLEIRKWLLKNPEEIILLYIEEHLDGHGDELAIQLEEYLSQFIFKPEDLKAYITDRHLPPHSCLNLPTNISKTDILRAKKQIVIVTKDCQKQQSSLNDYIFAGIGDIPLNPFTFFDSTMTQFTPYPDCARTTIFQDDIAHNSLWRIYEDRTAFSNVLHFEKKLLATDMQELLHCGINWPTMDMFSSNDDRLNASIWSWANDYPKESLTSQCTIFDRNSGIKNVSCSDSFEGFACQEEATHDFQAIVAQDRWQNGEKNCQLIAGKHWHFAVPVNGNQMFILQNNMAVKQLQHVWLNYTYTANGNWQANNWKRKNG